MKHAVMQVCNRQCRHTLDQCKTCFSQDTLIMAGTHLYNVFCMPIYQTSLVLRWFANLTRLSLWSQPSSTLNEDFQHACINSSRHTPGFHSMLTSSLHIRFRKRKDDFLALIDSVDIEINVNISDLDYAYEPVSLSDCRFRSNIRSTTP